MSIKLNTDNKDSEKLGVVSLGLLIVLFLLMFIFLFWILKKPTLHILEEAQKHAANYRQYYGSDAKNWAILFFAIWVGIGRISEIMITVNKGAIESFKTTSKLTFTDTVLGIGKLIFYFFSLLYAVGCIMMGGVVYYLDGLPQLIGIVIVWGYYFTPTEAAYRKNHHDRLAIFFTNLFLGWTVIGWIFSMIWSGTAIKSNITDAP